ncbi:MAG: metalloregulator ArsR/SmtB family transcription factor [Verrucomicrobiota bacterium]|nr:metalloregulator ArsR/SmtB family transcription factor [Verrucomicrobiota bacterium]
MKTKDNPQALTETELERIANRFRVIGEVMRLKILACLKEGSLTVNEMVEKTGGSQANISKHLQILFQEGILSRRKIKTAVEYSIADPGIFDLCYAVCGRPEPAAATNSKNTKAKVATTQRKLTTNKPSKW